MISDKTLRQVIDSCKSRLEKCDGTFIPSCFGFKNGKAEFCTYMPYQNNDQKKEMLIHAGEHLFISECKQSVIAFDSYCRIASSEKEKEEMLKNPLLELPETYPESMRKSLLTFLIFDFENEEDIKAKFFLYEEKNKKFIYEELPCPEEINGTIQDYLCQGYIKGLIRKSINIDYLESEKPNILETIDFTENFALNMINLIIDDYPFFKDKEVMRSLQKIVDPETKESIIKHFLSKSDDDFLNNMFF